MDNSYALAAALTENGKTEAAWRILGSILNDNPNDIQALTCAAYLFLQTGALPQAYHFSRRATELAPRESAAWTNFGNAAAQMCLNDEAEQAYKNGIEVCQRAQDRNLLWLNLSGLYIDTGQFEKAEKYTKKLLEIAPESRSARANLGFCQLAQRKWVPGWQNYHFTVGSSWRKKVRYKDEPEWDGTEGKNVVIYADQGIGDEISFASMIPDAAKLCKKLIFDCDGRLEGLFRRSFPTVKVYGTRVKEEKWAKEDRDIDASLSVGQLGEFVRTKDSDFTGEAYLTPCPTRTSQWRSIFSTKQKPVIGIAWTGGVPKTNARNRKVSLEDLLPVLSIDAHFVSLQYKDSQAEIDAFRAKHPEVDLVQYRWATITDDYDDTAALIAACDYVLCIQTAVAHTAGGLGVPVTVLLPKATSWRYGTSGDSIPWYNSLKIIRQKEHGQWTAEIRRAAEVIADKFGLPKGAGTPTRDKRRPLRNGLDHIRPDGIAHDREVAGHAPV